MTYRVASWIHSRGEILLECICGIISPQWYRDETNFRLQMLRDHFDAEERREIENAVREGAN